MIGIDTNVLVRYIMQDDPKQAAVAARFIERLTKANPGHISVVALAELSWVLGRTYHATCDEITSKIGELLDTEVFVVEQSSIVRRALLRAENEAAEFADALIAALDRAAGCAETVTFDRSAAKRAGMRLLA